MRLFNPGLAIRVTANDDGTPAAFVWDGFTHRVESIEDVREPRLEWWSVTGEVHRTYFLVVTNQGMICEIYRDELGGEGRAPGSWWMARLWD